MAENKHKTFWEDNKAAMLATCGNFKFSPNSAPVLQANKPIRCPHCNKYVVLRWKVFIKEITEEEFLQANGYA